MYAGRPFHFYYESLLVKVVFLSNLPALIACIPLSLLLSPILRILHVGVFIASYIAASLELVMASIQWMIVGLLVERRLVLRDWGNGLVGFLRRHAALVLAVVLVITAVGVPLVNVRSRRLGMRHGGVSFIK